MSELKPLWPNGHKLGLISVSGEHEAGKSLFGLMVCPESVCVIDSERSVESYETAFGMKRIKRLDDIEGASTNAVIDVNSVTGLKADSVGRKRAFEAIVEKIPAGRWRVISVDVLTDIEDAFADYVELNAAEFGYSQSQFIKMSGLKWKCVKRLEKTILLKLMDKCETLVVCRHMRDKWENNVRRNEREAKGLDSIDELSSLTVILKRPVERDGSKPEEPAALLVKTRMTHAALADGKLTVRPLFPPRFPTFSPEVIRNYILNPANYGKLKKGEKAEKADLTDDEKLLIQSQIAADTRASAEAAAIQAQEAASLQPLPPPNLTGEATKPVKEKPSVKAAAPAKPSPLQQTNGSLSEPTLAAISRLKKALEITDADWQGVLERFDAPMDQNTSRRSAVAMDPADQERLATYLAAELESNGRQSKREEMQVFAAGN